jgi:hypothetical protein
VDDTGPDWDRARHVVVARHEDLETDEGIQAFMDEMLDGSAREDTESAGGLD